MVKKTFLELEPFLKKEKELEIKNLDEGDLVIDFNEEREDVYILLWKMLYTFDQEGYKILESLWEKGSLTPNKEGYLCIKDRNLKELIPIHNHLKREEVEKLAKDFNCSTQDIHVHHIDKDSKNNRLNNLEVLHKDNHANRHGFATWEELLNWRKINC